MVSPSLSGGLQIHGKKGRRPLRGCEYALKRQLLKIRQCGFSLTSSILLSTVITWQSSLAVASADSWGLTGGSGKWGMGLA